MQAGPSRSRPRQHNGYNGYSHPNNDSESEYSSSSEDVTEDEDGTDLTPALDAAILRTLAKIKQKNGVYGEEKVLEQELELAQSEAKRRGIRYRVSNGNEDDSGVINGTQKGKGKKPFLLADHHREALLSGRINEEDGDEDNGFGDRVGRVPLSYVQDQRKMRKEAIEAFKSLGGDADDHEEDQEEVGFVPVKKEEKEEEDEEGEEYKRFLLDMGGGEEEVRKLLGLGDAAVHFESLDSDDNEGEEEVPSGVGASVGKGKRKVKPVRAREGKEKDDDDFLMNYILNRGWIDKTSEKNTAYDGLPIDDKTTSKSRHIGHDQGDQVEDENEGNSDHPWGGLDEDEFDEKADEFENEYNFRYEEPGAAEITSHPRQIPSLVRRPDDTRKLKRAAKAERKALELQQKEEKMKAEKGKKRRDMEYELKGLRKEIGEEKWKVVEAVLEGDWEEGKWEEVIGKVLSEINDDDAGGKEGQLEMDDDNEKPTWDDDNVDEYENEEEEGGVGEGQGIEQVDAADQEDGPINMDADFIGFEPERKKRKKDKKSKKEKGKHVNGANDETEESLTVEEMAKKVKEALKEYKELDHEDMIDDLPTRFHYTQSAPTSFGLTPVEILLATDNELNQVMSVKHLAPYRRSYGLSGKGLGKRVRDLKDQLKGRRWGEENQLQMSNPSGGRNERERDGGWPMNFDNKQDVQGGENGESKVEGGKNQKVEKGEKGERGEGGKKKRMGKKERQRRAIASEAVNERAGQDGPSKNDEMPVNGVTENAVGGGEEVKKRRKKKKHNSGPVQS